jgi:hypothetical protein
MLRYYRINTNSITKLFLDTARLLFAAVNGKSATWGKEQDLTNACRSALARAQKIQGGKS